jgi:hypothetical protein
MSIKRVSRRSIPVVLALAFGFTLVVPSAPTLAEQGSVSTLKDGGVLRLRLGATDRFIFEPPTGPPSTTQSIGVSSGCRLSPASGTLVAFSTAGTGTVGFVGDAIGVRGSGEGNGQPCGRFDPGQKLVMDLVQPDGSPLEGKLIDFAEIDLELKFGATVKITGYAVDASGTPEKVLEEPYTSTGSDSGPDSADGDNYRIRFPRTGITAVNRLVFEIDGATGGASLEGGADGTLPCDGFLPDGTTTDVNSEGCQTRSLGDELLGTTDSLFHLIEADGVLDCGDATDPASGGEGTPTSTLERLANAIDPETGEPEPCTPIAYNLESGQGVAPGCETPQCILLEKDLLDQTTQFYWKVTWTPESADYPEFPTEFDFDFDGLNFRQLQPCDADADGDGFPELPGTDPWCVTDTSVDFNPITGLNTVTETYFGHGDPTGRR